MKKITILALHLGYGGIERCVSMLSNSLINNYDVNIVSIYKLYDKPSFELDERIKVTYLIDSDIALRMQKYKKLLKSLKMFDLIKTIHTDYTKKGKLLDFFKDGFNSIKVRKYRDKALENYLKEDVSDIYISTRFETSKILSKFNKGITIAWEHNDHNNNQKYIKNVVEATKNLNYFVLVSKELKDFYQPLLPNTKCIYIPNALDYYPKRVSELDNHKIISIGRLSKEKGFVDLIDVMKLVVSKYPDAILNIIGDGPELQNIENKIKENMLSDNIKLHGYQNRNYINDLLYHSSTYVMPSYTESFGIVLLEAFSFGIPTVAFDSAMGARELIDNNWDGYLIPNRDKEIMAKKICELLANQNRRIIMGANGIKKAAKYNIDNIKEYWIKLIEENI